MQSDRQGLGPTDVNLLEISSLVSLDVGGLTDTSISNEDTLELGTVSVLSLHAKDEKNALRVVNIPPTVGC